MLKFNVLFLIEFFIPDKGYPPFTDNYSAHIDHGQAQIIFGDLLKCYAN